MIRLNNHKQRQLFDPWGNLSPKRRQMLDHSWPGLFKEYILPELPVSELSPFFNAGFGRPTKDLYTVVGVLVLQQTHDLTDQEAVDQLAFNIQWHCVEHFRGIRFGQIHVSQNAVEHAHHRC